MHVLSRTVRFAVNDAVAGPAPAGESNGFAGSPSMHGLGRHYELDVRVAGEPDPVTGYLLDIKAIDRAARVGAVPVIAEACRTSPGSDPCLLVARVAESLRSALDEPGGPRLESVRWRLSPYYAVEVSARTPGPVLVRQRFDFSAAHRLHAPELTDEENRRLFGKCNHPSGHGHNYQLEVCVEVRPAGPREPGFALAELERVVQRAVLDRFDHKHLNVDVPEFSCEGGVQPTVENIARVCHDLLAAPVRELCRGATLRCVTVWETDRTSATYPG